MPTTAAADQVSTGNQPLAMVLPRTVSLYVVNYRDDTISKVRTSDFKILGALPTRHHPVGHHDAASRQGCRYAGSLGLPSTERHVGRGRPPRSACDGFRIAP